MARQSENRAGGQVGPEDSVISQPVPPAETGRVLRLAALVAVAVGLAALTAGACVLSYEPIHHLAIQSGVAPRLASIYPLIFDALLVLAGCSVLALRGAGLVSRIYAWLCLLVLLAGVAGGGAVHAAGVRYSRKLAGILAAVIPWALVLIGFGLLLALLRYARLRRQASRPSLAEQLATRLPPESPDVVVGDGPAVPAPRPEPAEAPVPNPALAALAVARQGEPATAPQPAVAASAGSAPAQAGTPATGTPHAGTPATGTPAAGTPAGAPPAAQPGRGDLAKSGQSGQSGQHTAPVRQADLQLRARIPRPAPASGRPPSGPAPASGRPPSAAGAAQAGSRPAAPLMPPVSTQQPAAGAAQPPPVPDRPAPAKSGQANPGSEPGTGQDEALQAGAAPSARPPSSSPGSGLSPAPTETDDKEKAEESAVPGGPPAFRRQRSSPTPPDEE